MQDIFKNLREKTGLSFDAIALELGVAMSTVWRWEKGQTSPSFRQLTKIKSLLKSKKRKA